MWSDDVGIAVVHRFPGRRLLLAASLMLLSACGSPPGPALDGAVQRPLPGRSDGAVASPPQSESPEGATRGLRVLSSGAGVAVCEAFLNGFQSTRSEPASLCDYPLDAENTDFRQPNWVSIDARDHLDLVKAMFLQAEWVNGWNYLFARSSPPKTEALPVLDRNYWLPLRGQIVESFTNGRASLQQSEFDANNDGKIDRVFRMTSWRVVPSPQEDQASPVASRRVEFATTCDGGGTRYRYIVDGEEGSDHYGVGLSRYLSGDGYFFLFKRVAYFGTSPDRAARVSNNGADRFGFSLDDGKDPASIGTGQYCEVR